LLEFGGGSGFEQGPQPLRNRLIQNMVVNCVQQVFAILVAGDETPDTAVNRAGREKGFGKAAFDGEIHDEGALLKQRLFLVAFGVTFDADMSELVTPDVSLMTVL